jgi:hypothetical protein
MSRLMGRATMTAATLQPSNTASARLLGYLGVQTQYVQYQSTVRATLAAKRYRLNFDVRLQVGAETDMTRVSSTTVLYVPLASLGPKSSGPRIYVLPELGSAVEIQCRHCRVTTQSNNTGPSAQRL